MNTPAKYSPPPFPCDLAALRDWLRERHGFALSDEARMTTGEHGTGILAAVQGRYQRLVETDNLGGIPWPSEVWQAVLVFEREKAQAPLFDLTESEVRL